MRSPFTITYNPDWKRRPPPIIEPESELEPSTELLIQDEPATSTTPALPATKDFGPVTTQPIHTVIEPKDPTT
jgi:hypothetical protein